MITDEHLKHWISEIQYYLDGIDKEVNRSKVEVSGVKLPNNSYVSFEYLQEKVETLNGIIRCIQKDMVTDSK